MPNAILLARGPLRPGLSAALTGFVYRSGGAILGHQQYVDPERQRYYTRLEWTLASDDRDAAVRGVAEEARSLGLAAEVSFSDAVPRVALFVSNLSHCLYDILGRWKSGEWKIEVPVVISNHGTLADAARRFGVDFREFPVTSENKAAQERRELELLRELGIELVVLARYMQVVGPELIEAYPGRIINIHHAFLPAFPGGRPYHAAFRRGVKLIGATSHYVTAELDAGPIIEQDVIRVDHTTSVDEMIRRGRDLEKVVLARAVWAHVQRRVIADEGRTIVF